MSKISSPTGMHAKAYLANAWKDRDSLSNSEKRGLSQLLYIVAFSHLENILSKIVRTRITTIKYHIIPKKAGFLKHTNNGISHEHSLQPALDSFTQLITIIEKECENAPLNIIINSFSKLFPSGISKYIGSNLNHDLEAIKDLRNLFAHGKDIVIYFEEPVDNVAHARPEDTQIFKPLSRLKAAGFINEISITGTSHVDYHDLLYSENSMKYFYEAIKKIEKELIDKCLMDHERTNIFVSPLPEIFS